MPNLRQWTIAMPLSAVALVTVLCLTVLKFQDGTLHFFVEMPGGIKLELGVEK